MTRSRSSSCRAPSTAVCPTPTWPSASLRASSTSSTTTERKPFEHQHEHRVQDELLDLVIGQAVRASCSHVHGELLMVPPRYEGREGDQRTAAAVKARAGPDATPGVLGDEVLELT